MKIKLAALTGMRRNIAAFFFGICATLTLPPIFIFPLIIPAYGGLFLLLRTSYSQKRAFADGWWWGWGFYITGLYWFCVALLTDPEKFAWMIPFALFGLTAVIALYSGIAALIYYHVKERKLASVLLFALVWTLVEYARGNLFGGFPWNLPGYAMNATLPTLQLASLMGIYGLTFVTVLLGAVCATQRRYAFPVWAVFGVLCIWGGLRVERAPHEFVDGVKLRLVQANIEESAKWNAERQITSMYEHIELTHAKGIDEITHVIWPETAVPYVLRDNSSLAKRLGDILPKGAYLITGVLRSEALPHQFDLRNSMAIIDSDGDVRGVYDKYRLVPFGEFLPLRFLIPKLLQTPVGEYDFSRGKGAIPESWPGIPPFLPLICYEAIFPDDAASLAADEPSWLLTITNDAWFGNSSGPYQHLEMARMRAVEQGIPLIRAANSGVSAVYDAYGRRLAYLPVGVKGFLDTPLPKPSQQRTIYRKLRHL